MTLPGSAAANRQRAAYDRIYASSGLHEKTKFYRWVTKNLRLACGCRLLDVACGEGGMLREAPAFSVDAVGVEISMEAIKRIKKGMPQARVILGDAESLPVSASSVDAVTCLGSIENFAKPLQSLREIYRVLKPGGVFATLVPNIYFAGDVLQALRCAEEQKPFQRYERAASPRQWKQLLSMQGFSIERMHGYVKTAPLFREGRLRSLKKFIGSHLLAALCPTNLAWSVLLVGRKTTPPSSGVPEPAWVWRVEWAYPGKPELLQEALESHE